MLGHVLPVNSAHILAPSPARTADVPRRPADIPAASHIPTPAHIPRPPYPWPVRAGSQAGRLASNAVISSSYRSVRAMSSRPSISRQRA